MPNSTPKIISNLLEQASKYQLPVAVVSNSEGLLEQEGSGYLAYLQMTQAGSKLCQPPTKYSGGSFVLIENSEPTLIGEEVDVQLLASRPLAWRHSSEESIRTHEMDTDLFKEIQAGEADNSPSNPIRCSWGMEYLVYVPQLGKVASLAATSKTMRKSAKEGFNGLVAERALVTWKSEYIDPKGSDFSWYSIKTVACSTGDSYDAPDITMLATAIESFQNPPKLDAVDEGTEDQ